MVWEPQLRAFFRPESLEAEGRARHDAYVSAKPFPHAVLDDFFPDDVVRAAARAVAPPDETWVRRQRDEAVKWGFPHEHLMPAPVRELIRELQSAPFLRFLEELSGIRGLIPDPHLEGGGLHQIEPGGYLDIHADFNVHSRTGLHRRLNLLLFLNEGWQEAWGGRLELWDTEMRQCVHSLLPVFNRCVIFKITDTSFHGHPHPLACPPGERRKSIALYYYSKERPAEEISPAHGVLYQRLPGEEGYPRVPGEAPPPGGAARPSLLRRALRRARRALRGS